MQSLNPQRSLQAPPGCTGVLSQFSCCSARPGLQAPAGNISYRCMLSTRVPGSVSRRDMGEPSSARQLQSGRRAAMLIRMSGQTAQRNRRREPALTCSGGTQSRPQVSGSEHCAYLQLESSCQRATREMACWANNARSRAQGLPLPRLQRSHPGPAAGGRNRFHCCCIRPPLLVACLGSLHCDQLLYRPAYQAGRPCSSAAKDVRVAAPGQTCLGTILSLDM